MEVNFILVRVQIQNLGFAVKSSSVIGTMIIESGGCLLIQSTSFHPHQMYNLMLSPAYFRPG